MFPDDTAVSVATSDAPHEECGVFGVSTPHGEGVAQTVFFGLFALQHRGQEAAGIAVSDGSRVRLHKDTGLVANVFTQATTRPVGSKTTRLPRQLGKCCAASSTD